MSKTSSKLAAGVRKVKSEQQLGSGAKTPVEAAAVEKPVKSRQQRSRGSELHPARIWPD